MERKICKSFCKLEKPLGEFALDTRRRDGYHPYCKICKCEEQRRRSTFGLKPCLSQDIIPGKAYCTKCNELKDDVLFSPVKRGIKKVTSWCRECANKHESDTRYKKTIKIKLYWMNYKGGKCVDCSISPVDGWPPGCFDFHHIDPSKKEWRMSQLLHSYIKKDEEIKAELDGCVLLCANCHRKRHSRWQKDIDYVT